MALNSFVRFMRSMTILLFQVLPHLLSVFPNTFTQQSKEDARDL